MKLTRPVARSFVMRGVLSDTALPALDSSKTTMKLCYTYTADTRWSINDPPAPKPFASEAEVELRKTGNRYLYAVTNDHVVQAVQCQLRRRGQS